MSQFNIPTNSNKLLEKVLERINSNTEIQTLWKVINVNAMDRLGFSDHGQVHFQIVANIALRLSRILKKNDVEMSVVKNFGLSYEHAEVIVFLASIMHDLGMSIHRDSHEEYSLFLANNLLRELLEFLPIEERVIVTSETLHAIIGHRSGGKPYTIEAGIVRVSDALDMSKGRARIPYEKGEINIHSVSAVAVDEIEIEEGTKKPIQINIIMNNSAALFQIDDLLQSKLTGSGIEKYMSVRAYMGSEKETNLLTEVNFE